MRIEEAPPGRVPAAPKNIPELHRLLRETIVPRLGELAACRSVAELHSHPTWLQLGPLIQEVLETPELIDYSAGPAPPRNRYRFVAWNIERGIHLDAQIEALTTHPYLRETDVLLLTETDVGMARSGNRAVSQTIARELGFHHVFMPCYLSLVKGSGLEYFVEGENELALHGNAIVSRYPFGRIWGIPLPNGHDKMSRREKRVGSQTAVAAEIRLPGLPLTAVSIHLDAQSSQEHRRRQMRKVLDSLPPGCPAVLGGDWNTSTYNSSRALHAILGFALRVLMGVDHVIREHYLKPYQWFERRLFRMLAAEGFDYRSPNVPGELTASYDVSDVRATESLREWVPEWCFAFIRWALRNHGGVCPLKLDWFATRGVRAASPVVLHEFRNGRAAPLSDHDPVGVDILA